MKEIVLIVGFLVLIVGCGKDEAVCPPTDVYYPGDQVLGEVQGNKNDLAFGGSGEGIFIPVTDQTSDDINIGFWTVNEYDEIRDLLGFRIKPPYIREFQLTGIPRHFLENEHIAIAYYTKMKFDGDVADDQYTYDASKPNSLTITEWNSENSVLHGTFDLYFVIDGEKRNPDNPDRVKFTNCTFTVNVNKN